MTPGLTFLRPDGSAVAPGGLFDQPFLLLVFLRHLA